MSWSATKQEGMVPFRVSFELNRDEVFIWAIDEDEARIGATEQLVQNDLETIISTSDEYEMRYNNGPESVGAIGWRDGEGRWHDGLKPL